MAQDIKNIFNSHLGLRQNPNAGFDEFRQQLFLTMEADAVDRVFKFHVRKKQ